MLFMRNGIEFVEILDEYLKTKNISRRQFCSLVDIPTSTIATWKSKNAVPSVDLVVKIANFMNVSLDWLVYGELFEGANEQNTYENTFSRRSVIYRIEIALRNATNDFDYKFETQHEKYLKDIIDYESLINWKNYKIVLPISILQKIAEKLKVSLQWLLTGKNSSDSTDNESSNWLLGLAKKHENVLKGFDCLDEEEQKFVDDYIASKLELRQLRKEVEINKQKHK